MTENALSSCKSAKAELEARAHPKTKFDVPGAGQAAQRDAASQAAVPLVAGEIGDGTAEAAAEHTCARAEGREGFIVEMAIEGLY